MIREPVELFPPEIQTRKWSIRGEVMSIFRHKNYNNRTLKGHHENLYLLVQIPDYFSFFSFIFVHILCSYIVILIIEKNSKKKFEKKIQEKNE